MKIFFRSLDELQQFTMELDSQVSLQCRHCAKNHFVSHGFIYKQINRKEKHIVGKRIFCSNRYHHQGCGKTQQLYLSFCVPHFRYSTHHLAFFISYLSQRCGIQAAYQLATQAHNGRQSYRWLKRLKERLVRFRALLIKPPVYHGSFRSPYVSLILPTLYALTNHLASPTLSMFQAHFQLTLL